MWATVRRRDRAFRPTTRTRPGSSDSGVAPRGQCELGHGSEEMVRRVYAHLGTSRHRAEVVEYRIEQHFERLGDQLRRLGLDITSVITERAVPETKNPTDTEVQVGNEFPEWARRDSNARPLAPEPHEASDRQRPLA